jgi:hypothetical protein
VLHICLDDGSTGALTGERLWWRMAESQAGTHPRLVTIDRQPMSADRLPFAAGWFDFAACVGVAERLVEPAAFLAELCRVARGGYLECRREIAQIVQPDPTVRWLADLECNTLLFRECDPTAADIMEPLRRRIDAQVPIASSMATACASARLRPLIFVELVWKGRFKYRILRSDRAESHAM